MRKLLLAVWLAGAGWCAAGDLKPVGLPAPQREGGTPLMQLLNERKSAREFSPARLSPQVLSNLLWAAWGINRADGRRTAPSASNRQEIDLYVALADGVFLYDARQNRLEPVLPDDIRASTGMQDFVANVPVNLIYVADFVRMGAISQADKTLYSAAGAGFIAENVYLFCASQGLATVIRGMVDRPALAKLMRLRPEQQILLVQSVGHPLPSRTR